MKALGFVLGDTQILVGSPMTNSEGEFYYWTAEPFLAYIFSEDEAIYVAEKYKHRPLRILSFNDGEEEEEE